MKEFIYNYQEWARHYISNDIHFFGPTGAGKSTLIEQLKKRQSEAHAAEHTKLETAKFKDDINKIELMTYDTGGDEYFRVIWFNIIRKKPPLGIIFVTDHENQAKAKSDLKTIWSVLDAMKREKPKKTITRGILFFINKYDLWKNKYDTLEIAKQYHEDVLEYKKIGISPIIRWGCARYYRFNYKQIFDTIMSDFYRLIIDPKPNLSIYPEEGSIFYERSNK